MWVGTAFFLIFTTFIIFTSIWISTESDSFRKSHQSYSPIKTDAVYLSKDIRNMIANFCKFPGIFLSNDDIEDYIGPSDGPRCKMKSEEILNFSSDGSLELLPDIMRNSVLRDARCYYHELLSGVGKSNSSDVDWLLMDLQKLEVRQKVPVPFFDFAVVCKDKDNPVFVKPFLNFAQLFPNETEAGLRKTNDQPSEDDKPEDHRFESVAILFLPAVHHKLFAKFFVRSKQFIMKNDFQLFNMVTKVEENPADELMQLLGVGKTLNVFQKTREANYSTFFFGPKDVEALISSGAEFSTSRFQKFRNGMLGERECLDDGMRIFEDDLKIFQQFASSSKNSKILSTFFVDDYGKQKSLIDEALWFTLEKLKLDGVFERTNLILTTYSVAQSEEIDEERNPVFALRMSDRFQKSFPNRMHFLSKNVDRLMSTLNINALIISLMTNNLEGLEDLSPLYRHFSSNNSCADMGIPRNMCLCMEPHPTSAYNKKMTKEFLEKISGELREDILQYPCVRNVTILDNPEFFDYYHAKKGELRVVELIAIVKIERNSTSEAVVEVRRTFKFEPFFSAHHGYDNPRLMLPDGTNVAINSICN